MSDRSTAAAEGVALRFGENLHHARKQVDLSQEKLAELASLHRTAIGMLERGQRLARLDTLVKLTSVLEASADELLAGIQWVPRQPSMGGFSFFTLPTSRTDAGRPGRGG
jgi:transcriptional regulator with XRE-family HTH domain